MKRRWLVLLVTICAVALLGTGCGQKAPDTAQTGDQSWNKIKESGEFIVGLDDNYPPAGFRDKAGELVGVDIDLAKEAAKRLGVKAVFKPVQWDGVLLNLKNGEIDLIWNALGVTPERQQEIGFTDVYMEDRNIIVVKSGSPIKTKADLAGKTIGLQLGSTAEEAVAKDEVSSKIKEVRKFESPTVALMDLEAGRIDAVVTNEMNGRYLITTEKTSDKFYILSAEEGDFGKEPYGVGVRKEDKAFLAELNRVLDEMKADGTSAKISNQWFGSDIIK
ncbi:amino acid ABC transporter substrate-binding protein [Desulfosporosinus youngiae]|uniref:Periplasmic component of amino acid ABC-type transporter/signal transduction system n=1 Tax=Desulfosporosinus youngiae DSM 17734 TaxID=768710 RepID=H5Y3P1_9FIRM|nr:amino acid ABC transporter substrate-binding protein [Desulfosporosinus youngiae]EHQ89285.1 periplasmic component of amino acid ABC-type transporter/signal transduction system [Desulfosporosinus youngiae DSM 17734]